MEITELIRALQRIGLAATFDDLRELLWLAGHIHGEPGGLGNAQPKPPAAPAAPRESVESANTSSRAKGDRTTNSVATTGNASQSDEVFANKRGEGASARPIRVRGAPALGQALAIGRALRPVLRRRAGHVLVMDEQATAEHVAGSGLGAIVYRPLRERWFDLVLISEQMASMAAWQPVLSEFERLLGRAGFRSVRSMLLETDSAGLISLHADGLPVTARTLRDRTGRTLVLMLSDCTSAAWNDGRMGAWMASLAAEAPLAVAQYLPQSLWPNTAVGFAELRVRSPALAARTGKLHVRRPSWAVDEPGVVMPVFALTPSMIHSWARMTVGAGNAWSTAALMPLPDEGVSESSAPAAAAPMPADHRLKRFRAFAGRDAQLLAAYFSAVRPLTPPVMRVVHRAMTSESGSVALAQVLLGGLLYPLAAAAEVRRNPDDVEYEFYSGLRALLSTTLTERDVIRVNRGLYDYLVELGGTPFDFFALLADTGGGERLPEAALPFARFAREQFRRFAGSGMVAERGQFRLAVNTLEIRRRSGGFVFSYADGGSEREWRHPAPGASEALFDALAEQVVRGHDWRRGLEVVNQLLPHDLIALLNTRTDDYLCELVLDDASTKYPWEILLSILDEDHESVARRRGFTRRVRGMRIKTPATTPHGPALVIGFGGSASHPFDGSSMDSITAQALRNLSGGGLHVVDAESALKVLVSRTWRIVHIVQGNIQPGRPQMQGSGVGYPGFRELMGVFEDLRQVPELVFIDHEGARDLAPRIVALGAAVVVAAPGHAVEIEAADFASTFYEHLYMGESLIESVRSARRSTTISLGMDAAGSECYGRPDYRFKPAEPAAEDVSTGAASPAPDSGHTRPLRLLFTGVDEELGWLAEAIRKEFGGLRDLLFHFLPSYAGPVVLNALLNDSRPGLADWDAVICVIGAEHRVAASGAGTGPEALSAREAVYEEAVRRGKPVFGFIREPDPHETEDDWAALGDVDILFANRLAREQPVARVQARGDLVSAVLRCIYDLRREFDTKGVIAAKEPDTSATATDDFSREPRWVLVAGSGSKNKLSKKLLETCHGLGAALAHAGYGLITGGWRGVDEAVALRFAAELEGIRLPVDDRLLQVVPKHKTPVAKQGAVIEVDKGDDEYTECIRRASYLVILGGSGGTEKVAHLALRTNCIVLPLAETGGVARRVHAQIKAQGPNERQRFVTDTLLGELLAACPEVGVRVVRLIGELERQQMR